MNPLKPRNIKLVLEYDGSSFFGFQRQPQRMTVQEALEKALSSLLNRKTKIAAASGRTDTGVHAMGQIVNFKTVSPMPTAQIQKGLNGLLPMAVAVREVKEVRDKFHARFDARSKTYEYRVWNDPTRSPLNRAGTFHVREPLNVSKMRAAAKYFIGRHDFKSFATTSKISGKNQRTAKSTVRTINRFQIIKSGPLIRLIVEGDGFLYRMVRNLTGVLIEVGRGKLGLTELVKILKGRDRRLAPAAAGPQGLILVNVTYSD